MGSRQAQALRQVADELIAALDEPFAAAWRLLVDRHGPKQAARLFAQVLRTIEERGERGVAQGVAAAAVRTRASADTRIAFDQLPSSLATVEVLPATVADYDVLIGGVQ